MHKLDSGGAVLMRCPHRKPCHSRQMMEFDVRCRGLPQDLKEGSTITLKGTRQDGSTYEFPLNHTYNNNQINWFKAGSALNYMKEHPQ